jgi:hypothetical protein
VAVLTRKAPKAHALANLPKTGRQDLVQDIREGDVGTLRLVNGGRTSERETFDKTGASRKVYYVLALTEEGELLQSYVNAGDQGYLPGFDAVESGDMSMGPVTKYQDSLRAALESAMGLVAADTADGSQAGEDTAGASSPEEEQKRAESRDETSRESSGYVQAVVDALFAWYGALLLGLLAGGLGAWGILHRKYSGKISRRKKRISKLKKDLYDERREENKSDSKISNIWNNKEERKDERIEKLRSEVKGKNKEIKDLKEKVRRLRKEKGRGSESRKRGSASGHSQRFGTSDSASQTPQQSSGNRTADLIGRAFVKWCKDAGAAMVDRHSMFANRLGEGLPEAELRRIFREKNAAGIVFADDVQDAVEYWLVRVDGKDFLLPQPQRSGFREVEKCFQANCTSPKQLREFEPAKLQSSGGKYELKSEGRLA